MILDYDHKIKNIYYKFYNYKNNKLHYNIDVKCRQIYDKKYINWNDFYKQKHLNEFSIIK